MSRKYHPDKQGSNEDTTELFQRLNKAYEVLGKEKVREVYDDFLKNPKKGEAFHYYNYYKAVYLPKTDPTAVLTTFFFLLSVI